ncbi:uncharacterized protein A1O9_10787, partial [Exophiala aquamarina CBS 119918]
MQCSPLPHFPPFCPSFKRHRSSIDNSRFATNLTLPKPIAAPLWAPLPSPPMSGSPPPEPPTDPPQIAGRRRKRSLTPPATTAPALTSPALTSSEQTASVLGTRARGGEILTQLVPQPGPYASTSYRPSSSTSTVAVTDPEFLSQSPISPRATRKPKPHVTSACVNCKRKHLRCDESRPCRRCVQSGKE